MEYVVVKDGEWIEPVMKNYKLACCDCGLIHKVDFRIRKGHIQFRAIRDRRATGQRRRYMPHIRRAR
jgi:hypothetical protein